MLQHFAVNPEYFVKPLALFPKKLEILPWQWTTRGCLFL